MEQATNQSSNPKLTEVMPKYIRERMAQRRNHTAQPSSATAQSSSIEEQPENEIEQPELDKAEPQEQPTIVEPKPSENEADDKEHNDAKAWQGRLTKEQASHKDTASRLLAETEARQKAEAQVKVEAEKRTALEQRLAALEQGKQQPEAQSIEDFTEQELGEVEQYFGPLGKKIVDHLRQKPTQPVPPDVGKIVDERLQKVQEQQATQSKEMAFAKAVSEQIPEFQGLLTDSAFGQFLNDKVVDWAGNTAADFVFQIGQSKDISKLPKLRELIDEYNQSKQPPKENITTPPSNKSASVKAPKAKPKMTAKDIAYKNKLARTPGKTEELRQFLAQFDHSKKD